MSFRTYPPVVVLTVAGHTHGGQVNIPLLGPPIVPSKFGQRYAAGHVVEDGRHLFVSTGTGTSILPVRFRVPPEITLLELRSVVSAGSRASAEGGSCEPCTITRTPVTSFEANAIAGLPMGAVPTIAGYYVVLDGGAAMHGAFGRTTWPGVPARLRIWRGTHYLQSVAREPATTPEHGA